MALVELQKNQHRKDMWVYGNLVRSELPALFSTSAKKVVEAVNEQAQERIVQKTDINLY